MEAQVMAAMVEAVKAIVTAGVLLGAGWVVFCWGLGKS